MSDRSAELLSPPGDFHDLEILIRGRIRDVIGEILDEELESALGASGHQRVADYSEGLRPPIPSEDAHHFEQSRPPRMGGGGAG